MARIRAERLHHLAHSTRCPLMIGIFCLTGYPNHAILSQGAGQEPHIRGLSAQPCVGCLVKNMARVKQRQNRVDVEQIPGQSVSSSNSLTNSGVTGAQFGRTGKSFMPLRIFAGFLGEDNPRRASSEMTSPMDTRRCSAWARAASSTSLSRLSVVLMAQLYAHHASRITNFQNQPDLINTEIAVLRKGA